MKLSNYLSNSTALLGGGTYASSSCDISRAAANAFFPGLRFVGPLPFPPFHAANSFAVWLLSISFCVRRTPRLGRGASTVSTTSLGSLSLSLSEEDEEEGGRLSGGGGAGCCCWL